jgi:hypothetical protein
MALHPLDPIIVVGTVGRLPSEIAVSGLVLLLAELIVWDGNGGTQTDHAKGSTLTTFKYHRTNSILSNHPKRSSITRSVVAASWGCPDRSPYHHHHQRLPVAEPLTNNVSPLPLWRT